eukprot:CAMPEP_0117424880 /NCGR_PEP_ID=MMETSP0758-20121206/5234_1 /TAXON_ID=63605 /ORGANISM="Percolomonas cosmopolitus, Strain AE-1 (ATCC 50343)" /LENGTH=1190 /DNA_ID=CAMNT_0005208971 /DNA_START=203 /DNA_END=3776 /DNA_ORIENTATION=+
MTQDKVKLVKSIQQHIKTPGIVFTPFIKELQREEEEEKINKTPKKRRVQTIPIKRPKNFEDHLVPPKEWTPLNVEKNTYIESPPTLPLFSTKRTSSQHSLFVEEEEANEEPSSLERAAEETPRAVDLFTSEEQLNIVRIELETKDNQLIHQMKREEERIKKLKRTLESWKSLHLKERNTMNILLRLCEKQKIAHKHLQPLIEKVHDYYDTKRDKIRIPSEYDLYLETVGILQKIACDVKNIPFDMNAWKKKWETPMVGDLIHEMQYQNDKMMDILKYADGKKVEMACQTDIDHRIFKKVEETKEAIQHTLQPHHQLNDLLFQESNSSGFLFQTDSLNAMKRTDHLNVKETEENITPTARKMNVIMSDLVAEKQRTKALFENYEKDYLRERQTYRAEFDQNMKLKTELLSTLNDPKTSKHKRKMTQIQIDRLEAHMSQLTRQHNQKSELILKQITTNKQRNADSEHHITAIQKRIEFYKREQDIYLREQHLKLREAHPQEEENTNEVGPEGFVTLMFTDVQSSTALWEHSVDMMAESIRLHNQCIRAILKETGGYEVKTEGDAFMCAFESPKRAILCAMKIQKRLLKVKWPKQLLKVPEGEEIRDPKTNALLYRGLRVRMGLHCGHPIREFDEVTKRWDYFGPMVNRSARVEGQAQGGQVIISNNIWDSCGDQFFDKEIVPHLKEKLRMTYVGVVTLKGLDEPETLRMILPESLSTRQFKKATPVQKELDEIIKSNPDLIDRYELLKASQQQYDQAEENRTKTMTTTAPTAPQPIIITPTSESTPLSPTQPIIEKKVIIKESKKYKKKLDHLKRQHSKEKFLFTENVNSMQKMMKKQAEVISLEKSILDAEKNNTVEENRVLQETINMLKVKINVMSKRAQSNLEKAKVYAEKYKITQELSQIQEKQLLEMEEKNLHLDKQLKNSRAYNKQTTKQYSALAKRVDELKLEKNLADKHRNVVVHHVKLYTEQTSKQFERLHTWIAIYGRYYPLHCQLVDSLQIMSDAEYHEAIEKYEALSTDISTILEQTPSAPRHLEKMPTSFSDGIPQMTVSDVLHDRLQESFSMLINALVRYKHQDSVSRKHLASIKATLSPKLLMKETTQKVVDDLPNMEDIETILNISIAPFEVPKVSSMKPLLVDDMLDPMIPSITTPDGNESPIVRRRKKRKKRKTKQNERPLGIIPLVANLMYQI